jgi:DNA-binding Lrp family transcriptional regulator
MSNDYIGDLSEVRLFDLVKPLVDGKKSGMVMIKGRTAAELYIEGGSIVHGKTDTLVGEEAIPAIMDLDDGRVTFNWQLSPEKRTVRTATDQLISNWARREEEWLKVKKVTTSSDEVFSIVVDCGGTSRSIPAKQWGVLALCNGMRSISDIATLLGRSVFEVSEMICEMVNTGLLEKAEVAVTPEARLKGTVDQNFFVTVETELKKVVGPIGRVIINDTLAAFEESRESFPKDRVMSFIRTVSDQIVEEQKRNQFDKAVYFAWLPMLEND